MNSLGGMKVNRKQWLSSFSKRSNGRRKTVMSLERGVKVGARHAVSLQRRHSQPVLASEMIPLVSAVPNVTIPRYQGKLPPRGWAAKEHRKSILSGRLRPIDIHLLG